MKRAVVVGGGVSGLAAAWRLTTLARESGGPVEVLLLEASARLGGKVLTLRHDNLLIEGGPQGFLDRQGRVSELIEELGLGSEIVAPNPQARRRFLYVDGRFRRVAPHPLGLLRERLVSASGVLRALREPIVRRGPMDLRQRESVDAFFRRRFGPQVAQRLIAPALLGVFAGDTRQLSMQLAFPAVAEMEAAHGSVIRAALRSLRRRGDRPVTRSMLSLRGGLQQLTSALEGQLRGAGQVVRLESPVSAVDKVAQGGFAVRVGRETIHANAVVLACEAPQAARLLPSLLPETAARLARVPTPPVRVVAHAYRRQHLTRGDTRKGESRLPQGYGALVPRGQGLQTLGVLFEHEAFPHRAPEGTLLVRSMLGGAWDEDLPQTTGDVEQLAIDEFRRMVEVPAIEPIQLQQVHWQDAIPQYPTDHPETVERALRELQVVPGVALAGTLLRGPGFADAVGNGLDAAATVLGALRG